MDKDASGHRLAVVGAGYWGVNYVRLLDRLPEVRSVVVCDPRIARLKEIGERFPRVDLVDDLADVLESPEVDAAIVATPATSHHPVATRLLEAGKHVLVEKPLTTNSREAAEVIDLADRRRLTLAVGHTFLHHPAVQKVKEYVSAPGFGPYYLYSRRTNLGPIRHDVSAIWDLAPHDVSIFNHLLDSRPVWVSGVAHHALRSPMADVGFVSLGYPGNVIAHLHVSWADPDKVRELVVVGRDRRIVFNDLSVNERVRVYEKGVAPIDTDTDEYGQAQLEIRDGDIISPRIGTSEPLANQCADFLAAMAEGRRPISHGGTGLDVVKVMEAIDRSIELNGAPVLVDGLTLVDTRDDQLVASLRGSPTLATSA